MDEHFDTFQEVYDERVQAKYGFWRRVVEHSVTAFLKCGDLRDSPELHKLSTAPKQAVRWDNLGFCLTGWIGLITVRSYGSGEACYPDGAQAHPLTV
jgi:hypothetical protein